MPTSRRYSDSGWIDSHCHLNELATAPAQLKEAKQAQIEYFIVPGTAPQQWSDVIAWQSAHCAIALGTHPWFVDPNEDQIGQLIVALQQHEVVAIGEIGLDFYSNQSQPRPHRALQQRLFEAQLMIAKAHRLPVIVHSVKAHQQVIDTLRRLAIEDGVVHAFIGSAELAQQYIELGFHLGIGPLILKSPKTRAALAQVPLSQMLLETDAPFGNSHSAANPLLQILSVAQCVAEIKQISLAQLQHATRGNTQRLFRLPADH
ncbi:TatD family hydrolase [Reinekea forsetii]|jgi:TatD DNase family protein|uniref:Hydrolase, TatD family protein n=1 Tax=Reinekea forsetii TaxID=1336806 RepID=A0A2K8KMZ6_9GAMM|nr:TatD family hydrolase [Reinekea forsetii]ATX76062.1 hydrolase, TatD family protein [Reinekea forsetii]MDO7645191.1 TatD family hydrolase [Reinekea forsetii]